MEERWWERPAAFVADYWWVILAVIVIGISAFFTRQYWLPESLTKSVDSTPTEIFVETQPESTLYPTLGSSEPAVTSTGGTEYSSFNGTNSSTLITPPTVTLETSSWNSFSDKYIGYTIQYPSNWYLQPLQNPKDGSWESALISDVPGNTSPQMSSSDENARLLIIGYDRNGQSQIEWFIDNWNWITGQISDFSVDNHPAVKASFSSGENIDFSGEIILIDLGEQSLVLQIQGRTGSPSFQTIIEIISKLQID